MAYRDHFASLLDAILAACPGLSQRALSERAGLSPGWVAAFRAGGGANLQNMDRVVVACRDLCPTGPSGGEVRRLLGLLDGCRLSLPVPGRAA